MGGFAGFFARRHYELTVEVTEGAARGGPTGPGARALSGLAALLDDADSAEASLHGAGTPVSTGTHAFAALLDDLTVNGIGHARRPAPVGQEAAAAHVFGPARAPVPPTPVPPPASTVPTAATPIVPVPPIPVPASTVLPTGAVPTVAVPMLPVPTVAVPMQSSPLPATPTATARVPSLRSQPGDLVLVVGLRADAVRVASAMASSVIAATVRVAGDAGADGAVRAEDRRGALAARAAGVERGSAAFVACGWDARTAEIITALSPDQVWVAVDAGRKSDDTAHWVGTVVDTVPVAGVAVEGASTTASPETVRELGLPIGWVDGRPIP